MTINKENNPDKKTHFVGIRLTEEEWKLLLNKSKNNISEYVRYKIFGEKSLKEKYGE